MAWRTLTILVCLVGVGPGMAQQPARPFSWLSFWTTGAKNCPSVGCCPDDYCRKPWSTIPPVPRCGGPDDYCRKAMPCLTDIIRGCGCDDYCRKTLPCLLCPPHSPYLRCAPCEVQGRP